MNVEDMNLKEEDEDVDMESIRVAEPAAQGSEEAAVAGTPRRLGTNTPKRQSRSPAKKEEAAQSPTVKDDEEMLGGDVTLKLEPGRPPKLQRTTSRKVERRPPPLFFEYEDKTDEATSTFSLLQHCTYANKYLGTTESALECDCAEEWGKSPPKFHGITQPAMQVPNSVHRCIDANEPCMWRGLGLHQSRHAHGMWRGLRMRSRLPKPALPAKAVRRCYGHQNGEERLRSSHQHGTQAQRLHL